MADMNMPQRGGKRKLQPPRLDLTPMVDLGFILITFFIFTTTLAQRRAIDLTMPDNEPTKMPTVVVAESTITLIPVKDHRIIWYEGALTDPDQLHACIIDSIRTVLLKKKNKVRALPASLSKNAHKMYVLIKPANSCVYQDVITLLDDMKIVDAPVYAILDITPDEEKMVREKF